MGELHVYDSEGRALHPEGGDDDRGMANYFSSLVFALQPNPDGARPRLEAYLRVTTDERKEQVSIRYYGDDPATLFEDCRSAVERELVQGRGWSIRRPRGRDPEQVFWNAIWNGEPRQRNTTVESLFRDGLGLDTVEADIVQSMLDEEGAPTPRFTASGYEQIAEALPYFIESDHTVTVSRSNHAPPDATDIHFTMDDRQRQAFDLHGETRDHVEEVKKQKRRRRQQSSYETIEEALRRLDDLNADQDEVERKLSEALDRTFSGLAVLPERKVRELRGGSPGGGPGRPGTAGGRGGGPASRKTIGIAAIAVIGIMFVGASLVMFGVVDLPGLSGGGGGGPDVSVATVNASGFTVSVANGGAGATYDVNVSESDSTDLVASKELNTAANGSGRVTFANLSAGNYSVEVTSGSRTIGRENVSLPVGEPETQTATPTATPTNGTQTGSANESTSTPLPPPTETPTPTPTPTPTTNTTQAVDLGGTAARVSPAGTHSR